MLDPLSILIAALAAPDRRKPPRPRRNLLPWPDPNDPRNQNYGHNGPGVKAPPANSYPQGFPYFTPRPPHPPYPRAHSSRA